MRRLPSWSPLAVICAASAILLVVLGTQLTFFNDDWFELLQRPGLASHGGVDVFLAPANGNLIALLMGVDKLLVALFGLSSQLPYRIVLAAIVVAASVLVYVLVSARVGRVAGFVSAAVLLFLGPASEDLLFLGAALDLIGSLAAGLGALVALERDTPRRNAIACALLVCAILTSNGGIPFVVAAAVVIALRRRPGQLWIIAVPTIVFLLWWAFDGSSGPAYLTGANIKHLPRYVIDAISSGLASGTGFGHSADPLTGGHVELVILLVAVVVWILRGARPTPYTLVFLAAGFSFWGLTGASFTPGREPMASRYQFVDVALLILIAAELLRGVRINRVLTALLLIGGTTVVTLNITLLLDGFRSMRTESGFVKADLGALDLARRVAPPNFQLTNSVAHDPFVSGITAGKYFAATRAHGALPSYSPAQLLGATPAQRQSADSVLVFAGAVVDSRSPRQRPSVGCARLSLAPRSIVEHEMPPGGAQVTNPGTTLLGLGIRRFAPPGRPTYNAVLTPHSGVRMTIRRDGAPEAWHLVANNPGAAAAVIAVCAI